MPTHCVRSPAAVGQRTPFPFRQRAIPVPPAATDLTTFTHPRLQRENVFRRCSALLRENFDHGEKTCRMKRNRKYNTEYTTRVKESRGVGNHAKASAPVHCNLAGTYENAISKTSHISRQDLGHEFHYRETRNSPSSKFQRRNMYINHSSSIPPISSPKTPNPNQ